MIPISPWDSPNLREYNKSVTPSFNSIIRTKQSRTEID